MAVYCANDYFCVSNTGNLSLDDTYTQSGVYNLRDYYVGNIKGYVIYFTGSLWCLSDNLGGSCYLQGKYPYSGFCPDLSISYVSSTICLTPTPTQTIGCENISFDAVFEVNITNTPSITPTQTKTPTITPTPTTTNFCPLINVSASISYISPTPTHTMTQTPETIAQRNRAPVISCTFNGDVSFTTVNSIISCPVSRQFQDCSTGFIYRTSSNVTNPSGGDFSQFMIFEGLVDGVYRCVTYLGLDSNNQATNQINLQVGPIGYSNLGQCNLCFNATTLSPTPTPTLTPTPTVTPSGGLCLGLCSVLYISFDSQQIYTLDLSSFSYQPLPFSNVGSSSDIAHTVNRLFAITTNDLRVWNISLCPFSSNYVKQVLRSPGTPAFGTGLFAINDNTLLTWDGSPGISPRSILRINLTPNLDTINSSNINVLFSLPIGREPFGDLLLTNNNKLIIFNRDSDNDVFISQFIYPTGGVPEVDIQLTQYTWNPPFGISLSLFFDNGNIFILDGDGVVSSISNTYPYTVTEYFNFGFDSVGTSQIQSCINVEFVPYTPQVTYYAYKLCDDTTGPQTYVYQTVPSLVTILNNSMFNINENNCWSYYGSYTSIPQNSTDDIVVFEGNYFTSVSPTQYNNCTQCIQSTCVPPPNLINVSLKYGYTIDGGPLISFQNGPETVVCDTVYYLVEGLINNTISSYGFGGVARYVVSLEIGSYVYTNQSECGCGTSGGFYYISTYEVVILISNCIIVNIWPCDYNDGTSPSNPNGTSGSGSSGSGAGGTNPGGGSSPTSDCQCTAAKTISGFQSTAFYTDCNGNPAQITVPGNTGIPSTSTACFCRQSGTEVTGPVILEACQTVQGGSSGSSNITNNCLDQISCN